MMNHNGNQDLNPYQPPSGGALPLDPSLIGTPNQVRAAYFEDEQRLRCCSIVYFIGGTVVAVPATAAFSGAIIMLSTPSLSQSFDFQLGLLATGVALIAVSLAYFWTACGLFWLLPLSIRLGIPLILPILVFPPAGTIAGWLVLKQISSPDAMLLVTKEYRTIARRTATPQRRISRAWVALIACQILVAVQILVLIVCGSF